jgi:hypothetical protein
VFGNSDKIYASPLLYQQLKDQSSLNPIGHMYGSIPIFVNSMFPYISNCLECSGTGVDKDDDTDCAKCRATGGKRVIGMVQNGSSMTLITEKLPRKFAPRFPKGLVIMPQLCKGLA